MGKVTEASLTDLLAKRHSEDIFVPQCKTGPTTTARRGELTIMDGWAMKRSWRHHGTHAYEIKVSRQDFLNDDKWHRALDYCHQFWFVCPSGLIDKDELPPAAGLIYASKTGTKLYRKKQAPRRDVQIPESLWIYLLMARTEIVGEYRPAMESVEYWRQWLQEKNEHRQLGYRVSLETRRIVEDFRVENAKLRDRIEALEEIEEFCKENGIRPTTGNFYRNQNRQRLEALRRVIPRSFEQDIRRAEQTLREVRRRVETERANGEGG